LGNRRGRKIRIRPSPGAQIHSANQDIPAPRGREPSRVMRTLVAYSSPDPENAWKRAAAQKFQPIVFSGRLETIRARTTEKLSTRTMTAASPSRRNSIRPLPFRRPRIRFVATRLTHRRHKDQASQAATFL
jgi:hypothetical protein